MKYAVLNSAGIHNLGCIIYLSYYPYHSNQEPEEVKDNRILCIKDKYDMESFSAESEDENTEDECVTKGNNTQKGNSRRKHHISWTLSEVMKLVEGVSEYGVGRWTEIKRLQFASSSHRTSVDLKVKQITVCFSTSFF